jgi:hypothetical protein
MLRSAKDLAGYAILATDGKIGEIDAFYFDDQSWTIRYIVADVGSWLAEEHVRKVRWSKRTMHVDLQRHTVEQSPAFDPSAPVNREYEVRLYDYYGRPRDSD